MKKPAILNITPPNGYTITFPSGHVITANHPNTFLEQCFKYIEANGLDSSTGWADRIWDEYCKQNERVDCVDTEAPEPRFTKDDLRQFGVTVGRWLDGGGQWVSTELSESRAKVCLTCPKNIHVGGCSGCKGVLEWLTGILGRRRDPSDDGLRSCSICHCFLSMKTRVSMEVMSDSPPAEDFPTWCWLRLEKEKEAIS